MRGGTDELWRLHYPPDVVAVCTVTRPPWENANLLAVKVGAAVVITERYDRSNDAIQEAEAIRKLFIASGWTGVSPRKTKTNE